ncbi:branched-chain amino acid ABC transporter substrate-binding protein [Comamonadaceae bacterium OH2545_COT-014]|nr:branched-chain amino acid ABC transporter substrate-binding protein [Comamonadaceae bacterium OH2545_COT-014]
MKLEQHFSWRRRAWLQSALALAGGSALGLGAAGAARAAGEPVQLALIESLSGPFANTGEAVYRNLLWAVERVNARGGVRTAEGQRPLALRRHDNKGQVAESLAALRAAIDSGARVVMQGNSSAVAAALIDAVNKHNAREPQRRVLFLNYSAIEPALTNALCSPWHFRFDAHADMRMAALMEVIKADKALGSIYLIGQDYSFGQTVLREARRQLGAQRPDVKIVGDELHPVGRVKDFLPYAAKIRASGAQAVLTGNWGNDLTLLVKAVRESGFEGRFYTFYGNALGAPAAIGDAGVGKVFAVADWLPNVPGEDSAAFYRAFRERFPKPEEDYVHMRMQLMIEALAQAIDAARSTEAAAVAPKLAQAKVSLAGRSGAMRAEDHQFQQPLVVGVMERHGTPGVAFDVEGSGYGFKVVRDIAPSDAAMPTTCKMPAIQE